MHSRACTSCASRCWTTCDRLPAPQADALGIAFGLTRAPRRTSSWSAWPCSTLLSESGREQPLVCLVDDAQWLDRASAQALAFVARRLQEESIVLVMATRTPVTDDRWVGLPRLVVGGLPDPAAMALLETAVPGALDVRVRTRIVAETHGNPLALLELPHWFTLTELTFGPAPSENAAVRSRLEEGFRRQLEPLPEPCRRLLLIAAADPLGDVGLLWRAAQRLGIGVEAAALVEANGLIELRQSVRFKHPLLRSVAYRSAGPPERQLVHGALANAIDPDHDPDRHAWHRGHAATGPDEAVAAALERCADRAAGNGDVVATAMFLERAAMLTPEGAGRTRRQLDAALAMLHAGTFDSGLHMLALAEHGPLTDLQRARIDQLRAQMWFGARRGNGALPLLVASAQRLESLHLELALDTYVDALTAALFAGRFASDPGPKEVGLAARNVPMPATPRPGDLLLQAVAARFVDGYPAAVTMLRSATRAFDSDGVTLEEGLRFMWLSAVVASDLWDHQSWDQLTRRHLDAVRGAGALSALPLALSTRVFVDLFAGDIAAASVLVTEIDAVSEAAEATLTPYGAIGLAAFLGHEDEAVPLIAAAMSDVAARGEGIGVSLTHWAQAMLCNGLGRYADALAAAQVAVASPDEMGVGNWALAEMVEAGVRAGDRVSAASACERLSVMTQASGTAWALGVAARCTAQLMDDSRAEDLYREAIDRLAPAGVQVELARARLLYGEWLRRTGRRVEAREQLRTAYDSFTAMGVDAFGSRARHELAATGETVRKRTPDTRQHLTAQELHIARLAANGLTNPEIAAKLFISPRTVEWHLRKVFAKLGVTARRHLREALGSSTRQSLSS